MDSGCWDQCLFRALEVLVRPSPIQERLRGVLHGGLARMDEDELPKAAREGYRSWLEALHQVDALAEDECGRLARQVVDWISALHDPPRGG